MVPNAAASASNQSPISGTSPGERLGAGGRYELVERIGSGGMGSVWRALDHKLGCERAVKVLDGGYSTIPAFVERFRREAMAASRVAHPNIVSVLDVAGDDERPVFLVMELLEGKTLSQMVKGNGRLPWAQVQRYIDQIAAGLGAAHAQGVVHRDVKPGNCLVLPDDQVKVLDFGIAKVTDMPAQVMALTAAGEIIGTCSYMAPEQIKGQVDKRSDIYALGVLTFRMLTGRVPFSHRDQDKVLLAHLTEPPPAPSSLVAGLPAGVDDFVLRMLAKQPHKRFDGMEELRRVLGGIERGGIERGMMVALDGPTAIPPSKSHTAMFEEAPTRAVMRDSTPGSTPGAAPVRVSLNTAPAGSGTLAQLEAQARLPGTVLLDDPVASPGASGGTVVVSGPLAPPVAFDGAVPPGSPAAGAGLVGGSMGVAPSLRESSVDARVAVPPRVVTVPTPVPRPLPGLATGSAAPPRVTRFSAPGERDDGGTMVRGLVWAFGGIALAAAVVVGWVLYTRHASSSPPSPTPPAAATIVADDGSEPAAEGDAAIEPGSAEPREESRAAGAAEQGVAVEAGKDGAAGEGEAPLVDAAREPEAAKDDAGAGGDAVVDPKAEGSIDAPVGSDGPEVDPKASKKRRPKAKTGDTKQPEVADPEPEPEPEPEPKKKKPKSGDLRDPF